MSPRPRAVLLTLWATFVVGTLVLNLLWPLPGQQDAWPWVMGLMAFPVAAVLVLSRRPTNGVGLALGAVGTAAAVIFVLTWYAVTFADAPQSRFAEALAGSGYVVQFAGLVALLHLFPTGRPMNGWHAGLFTVFAWLAVGLAALMPMRPGPLDVTGRPNPLGVPWLAVVVDDVGFGLLVVFALVGLGSLVARWRRAGPVERNQLKWFLAGGAAVVVLLLLLLTGVLRGNRYLEIAGAVFAVLAFWSLPAAMVVAITRYRLWDIDRIISRTLSYAVLVGVLGVVYVAGVLGLGSLLPLQGELTVAASTLAVAALFTPLRRRVQVRVDRRFNRPRYDGEQQLQRFVDRLRDELDPDDLAAAVCAVAAHTLQPAHVSLWRPHPGPGEGSTPPAPTSS